MAQVRLIRDLNEDLQNLGVRYTERDLRRMAHGYGLSESAVGTAGVVTGMKALGGDSVEVVDDDDDSVVSYGLLEQLLSVDPFSLNESDTSDLLEELKTKSFPDGEQGEIMEAIAEAYLYGLINRDRLDEEEKAELSEAFKKIRNLLGGGFKKIKKLVGGAANAVRRLARLDYKKHKSTIKRKAKKRARSASGKKSARAAARRESTGLEMDLKSLLSESVDSSGGDIAARFSRIFDLLEDELDGVAAIREDIDAKVSLLAESGDEDFGASVRPLLRVLQKCLETIESGNDK